MEALSEHNDLGFHSGMITDSAMMLARAGNITGRHKAIDSQVMVSGATLGSQELVDWAGSVSNLAIRPVGYTHDIDVLRRIENLFRSMLHWRWTCSDGQCGDVGWPPDQRKAAAPST